MGEILVGVKDGNDCPTPIHSQEVLYVPTWGANNVISVRYVHQAGSTVVSGGATQDRVEIHMNRVEIGISKLHRNTYVLSVDTLNAHMNYNQSIAVQAVSDLTSDLTSCLQLSGPLMEWHQWLRHLGFDNIKKGAKTTTAI